nr:MAG TPA: hypothetical protein [Caudoviricetes sp.]
MIRCKSRLAQRPTKSCNLNGKSYYIKKNNIITYKI